MRLRNLAESVIDSESHRDEIRYLFDNLNLSREEVVKAYVDYDLDVFAYKNEVYEPLAMRAVLHLHNLLPKSWHQDRQETISNLLKKCEPSTVVDMGFGVPGRYVRDYVLNRGNVELTFVDLYDSAFGFAEKLLDRSHKSWRDRINFKKLDMNTHEYPGDFDCYIFQDSLEHVKNATIYLERMVSQSPSSSKFILSLPIGEIVPAHTIAWKDKDEALGWLQEGGLNVYEYKEISVNREVDLFAQELDYDLQNLVVLCSKTK